VLACLSVIPDSILSLVGFDSHIIIMYNYSALAGLSTCVQCAWFVYCFFFFSAAFSQSHTDAELHNYMFLFCFLFQAQKDLPLGTTMMV
jgi:hypothetical protein